MEIDLEASVRKRFVELPSNCMHPFEFRSRIGNINPRAVMMDPQRHPRQVCYLVPGERSSLTARIPHTARKAPPSPIKPQFPSQNNGTPSARRIMGGRTPGKAPPSFAAPTILSRARLASNSHSAAGPSQPSPERSKRPPSSAHFNPTLPPKAPAYPRPPRRDETIISANGSPIANPWGQRQPTVLEEPEHEQETVPRSQKPPIESTSRPGLLEKRDPSATILFSVRTRSGVLVELDPNITPNNSDEDPFSQLTESAKKDVRADVMKLAERYGLLNVKA